MEAKDFWRLTLIVAIASSAAYWSALGMSFGFGMVAQGVQRVELHVPVVTGAILGVALVFLWRRFASLVGFALSATVIAALTRALEVVHFINEPATQIAVAQMATIYLASYMAAWLLACVVLRLSQDSKLELGLLDIRYE